MTRILKAVTAHGRRETQRPSRPEVPTPGGSTATPGDPTQEQIAQRAFQIWLESGQPQGQDLGNWLQAEAELRNGQERCD